MIESAAYYWLRCDSCKKRIDYGDYSAYESQADAWEHAEADDWTTDDQRHHCPSCPELPEETEAGDE